MAINERLTERLFTEADRALDRMTRQAKRQLLRAYRESYDEVRRRIADLYERYAKAGKLSYSDMAKYQRLVRLEAGIREELQTLGTRTRNIIRTALEVEADESYYRTMHAIEMGARQIKPISLSVRFGDLSPGAVERMILNPISGLTLPAILERNRQQVEWKIRQEITQGLIKGEGYADMARRLRETFLGDAVKATRVVQTEAHRVQNEARFAAAQEAAAAGVLMKKKWVARMDERTRDTHRALDGTEVDPDEKFTSPSGAQALHPGEFGVPAEDINCYCSHIYVVQGLEPKLRRVEGKIVPYITYEEWAKEKGIPPAKEVYARIQREKRAKGRAKRK